MDEARTVGQVSEALGITRRTLHHYDEIGLVVPSDRSPAGYRLYADADLVRLQQVVVYRRLGFGLDDIRALLDEPAGVESHLRRQREAVTTRLAELTELVTAIDHALERAMTTSENHADLARLKELVGPAFDEEYAHDAERRWGDTDAWRQARERTAGFTADDWARVQREADRLVEDFAAAFEGGAPADGDAAAALAERHRAQVEEHYDCDHAFQVTLARTYLDDERLAAPYEGRAPGLARYVHDAIVANAARHGVAG